MRIDVDLASLGPGALARSVHWQCQPGEARIAEQADTFVIVAGRPRESAKELDAVAIQERFCRLGSDWAMGLRGVYAVALIDARRRQVELVNDRMAVHGWCYAWRGNTLHFSDRADTIADGAELEPQAIFSYLFNHVIPSPDTVFRGVKRMPPGHRLIVAPSGSTLRPHWRPEFTEPRSPDFDALKEEFCTIVSGSVARDTARFGNESVGTFLSGGTDSSTVSGMLRRLSGHATRAYSIGFDADGYDEMAFARVAAQHFGLDHREYYLTPDDVATGIPKVAAHYDQPFGNSSAVAAYHCARVAREQGCTHLLAGDGGDELFGGNSRYAKQRVFGYYDRVPESVRRLVMNPLLGDNALAARLPWASKAASYVQQARVPMPDRLSMYNLIVRIGLDEVLTPRFRQRIEADLPMEEHRQVYRQSDGSHPVNRMLAFDWKLTLSDNDLPKVCGTTSLAGIGASFPLLSDELIDFSLKLPSEYKLKGLKLRWFFKEALRGFLPDQIIAKKKQGFGLPFGVWTLRNDSLGKLVDDALRSFATRGVVAPGFMTKLRRDLLPMHPGYYGELVYILAMMEFWMRERSPLFSVSRD